MNAVGGGVFDIWGVEGERYLGLSGSVEESDAAKEKCDLETEKIVGVGDRDIARG